MTNDANWANYANAFADAFSKVEICLALSLASSHSSSSWQTHISFSNRSQEFSAYLDKVVQVWRSRHFALRLRALLRIVSSIHQPIFIFPNSSVYSNIHPTIITEFG